MKVKIKKSTIPLSVSLEKTPMDQIYDLKNCVYILRNELSDKDQLIKSQTEQISQLIREKAENEKFINQLIVRLAGQTK